MSQKRTVIFRADGNREIGMGHFMRCISLAEMLNKNFPCTFAISEPGKYHKDEVKRVEGSLVSLPPGEGHFEAFLSIPSRGDIVVLDNYFFDTDYQIKVRATGCFLVCIDDMHDRHYVADIVINHSPSVDPGMFSRESYTRLLLGLDYVLLRNEFLLRAQKPGKVPKYHSLLICFGGSDINNLSLKYARMVNKLFPELLIHVLLGSAASGKEELKRWILEKQLQESIHYHENLNAGELIQLFERTRTCIVPSSGIMFEVIAVKRIIITGFFADNQENNAKKIVDDDRGIFFLGDMNSPDETLLKVLIEKSMEADYPNVAAGHSRLIDGLSGRRILNEFEKL